MADQYKDLPESGGGAGTVTSVTATSPLSSSGGTTPDISLTGVVDVSHGGTGRSTLTSGSVLVGAGTSLVSLVAPGASGNVLQSNGTTWTSVTPPPASPSITSINGDGTAAQTLVATTTGTDFTISDPGAGVHNFNLPSASATARGLVTTTTQTLAGLKTFSDNIRIGTTGGKIYLDTGVDYGIKRSSSSFVFWFNSGLENPAWSMAAQSFNYISTAPGTISMGDVNGATVIQTIKAYDASAGGNASGSLTVQAGNQTATGNTALSGNLVLSGGNNASNQTASTAGDATLNAGNQTHASGVSNAGALALSGGNATGSGAGGAVTISAGTSGSGTNGAIVFRTVNSTRATIDNLGNLNVANLTASLPVVTDASKNLASSTYATFAGNTTHSTLGGLTTGDAGHTQFALLAGRSGGQTLNGDTAASGDLLLVSTANATKGDIYLGVASNTTGVWVSSQNNLIIGTDFSGLADLVLQRQIDLAGTTHLSQATVPQITDSVGGGTYYGLAMQPSFSGENPAQAYGALFGITSSTDGTGGAVAALNLSADYSGSGDIDTIYGASLEVSASGTVTSEAITLVVIEPSGSGATNSQKVAIRCSGTLAETESADSTTTGTNNAYPVTSSNIYFTNAGGVTLNGLEGGNNGKRVLIQFLNGATINNNSGSAAAGDKIFTSNGLAITVVGRGCIEAIWSPTDNGWNVISQQL